MKRGSGGQSQATILKSIASEFTKFRAEASGHSPTQLKELVVAARTKGVTRSHLAAATGVCLNTIDNWTAKARPRAKRLNVIAEPKPVAMATIKREMESICVRLVSGIEIEFPRKAFDGEFLALLNGLGGRP